MANSKPRASKGVVKFVETYAINGAAILYLDVDTDVRSSAQCVPLADLGL